MAEKNDKNLTARPPVVVVMGHVDHGKTTLLDYVRKTNVAGKEAGGITQSIGAYEIEHKGKKITFIDTPGHEAFTKMRSRGANIADLAILIVAADDGIQPQTKESIGILKETKTPFVVAINKIDKPNADVEKTKNDLMQNEVFLEGFGGNVSWQEISAKSGQGVNELIDLLLLASEIEDFTFDPNTSASGFILESKMDPQRGITAVGIVKNGILHSGKHVATPSACGKIKILENFKGQRAEKLEPSSPFLILGFDSLPQSGEEFMSGDLDIIKAISEEMIIAPKIELLASENKKVPLNLILKADVSGSLEALSGIVKALTHEAIRVNILSESVGEITDNDIKSAATNGAIVIGFNTKLNKSAENLAKAQNVRVIFSKVIYELVKSIEDEIKAIEKPAPLGELEVMAIFSQKDRKQLVGGKVTSGLLKINIPIKILREGEEIGNGKITSLKQFKKEITQMLAPNECGVLIESAVTVAVGDVLVYPAPPKI